MNSYETTGEVVAVAVDLYWVCRSFAHLTWSKVKVKQSVHHKLDDENRVTEVKLQTDNKVLYVGYIFIFMP